MYKLNIKQVTEEYAEKYKPAVPAQRIKRVYEGREENRKVLQRVKEMVEHKNGVTKKAYLTVDYKAVSQWIYKKYNKLYPPKYLKQVHIKNYDSAELYGWIIEALDSAK